MTTQGQKANHDTASYICKYVGEFDRIIADEGHYLKDPSTDNHKVVLSTKAPKLWLLTATPLMNKTADLLGYLNLLWRDKWLQTKMIDDPDCHLLHNFEELQREYATLSVGKGEGPLPAPLWMLNPKYFSRMRVDGDLTAATAFEVLPCLMRRLCVSRNMNDLVECVDAEGQRQIIRIGDQIPGYTICTVELAFDREIQKEHDQAYHS